MNHEFSDEIGGVDFSDDEWGDGRGREQ